MRGAWFGGLAIGIAFLVLQCAVRPAARMPTSPPVQRAQYPPTRRVDVIDRIFGAEVRDPYRWLEDGASEEVKRWMRAEDAFARGELARIPVRGELLRRMSELAHQARRSPPQRCGDRYFYTHRTATE